LTNGFEIINAEETGHSRIGIAHIPVVVNGLTMNIERTRRIVFYANELNIRTILLPHSLPYGPVLGFYNPSKLSKQELKKRFGISKYHLVQKVFKFTSNTYGVNILLPGIIEVSGHVIYHSTFLYTPLAEDGNPFFQRKVFLSPVEEKLGFTRGRTLSVFNLGGFSYGVLHDEEILIPELLRAFKLSGASTLILSASPLLQNIERTVEVAKSLSYIFNQKLIIPGGFVIDEEGTTKHVTPSIVVSKEGEIIVKYERDNPSMIIVGEEPSRAPVEEFERVKAKLFSYLRDLFKLELNHGREGSPG
jgi:predicted amidohydrolase